MYNSVFQSAAYVNNMVMIQNYSIYYNSICIQIQYHLTCQYCVLASKHRKSACNPLYKIMLHHRKGCNLNCAVV